MNYLTLHILLGVITLISSSLAIISPKETYIKLVNISGLLSILSGSIVSVVNNMGVFEYCSKIVIYLLIIGIAQFHYFQKSSNLRYALATSVANVLTVTVTAILLSI